MEEYQLRLKQESMSTDDDGYHLALNRKPHELQKILLISSSINSLTNAINMHLKETASYELDVAAVSSEQDIQEVVDRIKPDLIICPYLTKKIPPEVYDNYLCWISWEDDSAETIAQKINAASGQPGLKVNLVEETCFFYNAIVDTSNLVDQHYTQDQKLEFRPGQMVLKMNGAVLFATKSPDKWVWVTHMKQKGSFKLPAEDAPKKRATLQLLINNLPQHLPTSHEEFSELAWKDIYYEFDKSLGVAYLHFDLYGGAMSTDQAIQLRRVYNYLAKEHSDVRAIVLLGGRDGFSNGIHLNVIQDAPDPVEESTNNIQSCNQRSN